MKRFDVGDQVVLKSGGPKMTISDIGNPLVFCNWFDRNGNRQSEGFQPGTLELWDVFNERETRRLEAVRSSADRGDYDPLAHYR